MPSVTSSVFESDIYTSGFSKLLTEYINPSCPDSAVGSPQVYNVSTRQCVGIPAANVVAAGATAPGCGGAPFRTEVNGQCYSTNSCTTTPSLTTACMNTQNIPYQKQPLAGPGVLANMYYQHNH